MALRPGKPTTQPRYIAGGETQVEVTDEPSPRFHGTLTNHLRGLLERADPSRETLGDLERSLKHLFGDTLTVKLSESTRDRTLFANELVSTAESLLVRLDQQHARQIIAVLEEVIARRELQEDYWPEGRLNLGIAYASLEEYDDARRWLDDAVNMLRHPSYVGRGEEMAA